jgi:hypothetical protein
MPADHVLRGDAAGVLILDRVHPGSFYSLRLLAPALIHRYT